MSSGLQAPVNYHGQVCLQDRQRSGQKCSDGKKISDSSHMDATLVSMKSQFPQLDQKKTDEGARCATISSTVS